MITIDFDKWPRREELVKYAAKYHLNMEDAIHELVNTGLSHYNGRLD